MGKIKLGGLGVIKNKRNKSDKKQWIAHEKLLKSAEVIFKIRARR